MERIPVDSSNLASVGYDEESQTLEVEFTAGTIYQYQGVSVETYHGLMAAPSKGAFFNCNIARLYIYIRLS